VRAVLALIAVLSLTAMPYTVLLPIFAGNVLHTDANGFGMAHGGDGHGRPRRCVADCAARHDSRSGAAHRRRHAAVRVSLLALAASTALWVAIPVLLAVGYGMITGMAGCNTLLQSLVPDHLRGRVMSLYTLFFLGMAPIGSLMAGALAAHLGTPTHHRCRGNWRDSRAILFWRALPGIRRYVLEQGLLPPEELVPTSP